MKIIRVGVALATNVFQVHGVDRNEKPVWRRQLSRVNWLKTLLETIEPGCKIGMEACGGAHDWARRLQVHGYEVRLIAPQFVKLYVKRNKNDANDAEATCHHAGKVGLVGFEPTTPWYASRTPHVARRRGCSPAALIV